PLPTAPRCCSCAGCDLRSCPVPQPVLLKVPFPSRCCYHRRDALNLATGSTAAFKSSSSSSSGISFEWLNTAATLSWSFWAPEIPGTPPYVPMPGPDAEFPFFLK
ncbi:unnamed protein product, partial [Heterosigma akashiwo]